jgi:glycosyltransferase domain-containing protein
MNPENNLTLVFLSNKPSLLDIQLEYLEKLNKKLTSPIIFAAFNYNKQTDVKNVGCNIENGLARFKLGVESIDTEYCKICADDDLFITHEFAPQLRILDNNPDIVNVMGLSLSYDSERKIGIPESLRPSYSSENPGTRICQLLLNYGHFFYGIYRTKVLKEALEILLKETTAPLGNNVVELGLALLSCISGKCSVYPAVTLIREPSASESWYNDLIILNQAENLKKLFMAILQKMHHQNECPLELMNINDFHFWFRQYLMKDLSCVAEKYKNLIKANSFQSKHAGRAYNIEKRDAYYLNRICEQKKVILNAHKTDN